jgi:hypothetical protein
VRVSIRREVSGVRQIAGAAAENRIGDRVRIAMSDKFLPYKYYGSSDNVRE